MRRHVIEPSVCLVVLAVNAIVLGVLDGWADVTTPRVLAILFGAFVIGLGVLALAERDRTRVRAAAASPLPAHFAEVSSRPVMTRSFAARMAVVVFVLIACRLLDAEVFDATLALTTVGLVLGGSIGNATGTALAVRRYEQAHGRTLYIADDSLRAPMFWRDAEREH